MTVAEGTVLAIQALSPVVSIMLFVHQRYILSIVMSLVSRMTAAETKIDHLQGLSTLPQATRAEVETDIRKALEPVHKAQETLRGMLVEIQASVHDVQERTHARDSTAARVADRRREPPRVTSGVAGFGGGDGPESTGRNRQE